MSLVADFYNITDHEIEKLSKTKSAYWMNVSSFWHRVSVKPVTHISSGEANWLSKIEADLEDNWRPKWMEEEGPEIFT